jgi:L-iditol 2-dehydrogenase
MVEMRSKASVLSPSLTLSVEERSVAAPGPHEVLVRIRSVGVCGSDIHYFEHGRIGEWRVETPIVLGHEASGVVVAVGSAVSSLSVGSRVAIEPGTPCGSCTQCRAGRYNLCPSVVFLATPPVDGAFAELLLVQEDFAHAIPDSLSDDAAALVEPLSVGVWACKKGRVGPGMTVLVTGSGPVGVMAALVARASGAARVIVSDVNPHRLAKAAALGLETIDTGSAGPVDSSGSASALSAVRASVLLECSGSPVAIDRGIRALEPAGTAVLVGMAADGQVPLPVDVIQSRELWVTGTFRYAGTYPSAIDLASRGVIDLDALVSKVFTLDEVHSALTHHRADPASMKVIVRVSEA